MLAVRQLRHVPLDVHVVIMQSGLLLQPFVCVGLEVRRVAGAALVGNHDLVPRLLHLLQDLHSFRIVVVKDRVRDLQEGRFVEIK